MATTADNTYPISSPGAFGSGKLKSVHGQSKTVWDVYQDLVHILSPSNGQLP